MPIDAGDLPTVLRQAHAWVADAVSTKARKYGARAKDWVLLVYANYSFCDRTQWNLVREKVADIKVFKAVYALTADGQQVHTLKP